MHCVGCVQIYFILSLLSWLPLLHCCIERLQELPGRLLAEGKIAADFDFTETDESLAQAYEAMEHAVKSSFYPHAQLPTDDCDGDLAHCNHFGQGCCKKLLKDQEVAEGALLLSAHCVRRRRPRKLRGMTSASRSSCVSAPCTKWR